MPTVSSKTGRLKTPGKECSAPVTSFPDIFILVPVKDAVEYLPNLWKNIRTLTYPHDRISLAFLESDSDDDTYAAIEGHLPELQDEFAKVKLCFSKETGTLLLRLI